MAPGKTITIRIPFRDYPGTFVFHCHVLVHEDHGIGRLEGFETRTVANVTRDYLALVFAG